MKTWISKHFPRIWQSIDQEIKNIEMEMTIGLRFASTGKRNTLREFENANLPFAFFQREMME